MVMKVACDVDDVLIPWRRIALPQLAHLFGKEVAYNDQHSPDIADCFGVSPEEMRQALEDIRPALHAYG